MKREGKSSVSLGLCGCGFSEILVRWCRLMVSRNFFFQLWGMGFLHVSCSQNARKYSCSANKILLGKPRLQLENLLGIMMDFGSCRTARCSFSRWVYFWSNIKITFSLLPFEPEIVKSMHIVHKNLYSAQPCMFPINWKKKKKRKKK